MAYPKLSSLYPHLTDFQANPAFHEPLKYGATTNRKLNNVCSFWNLIGARGTGHGNRCDTCGVLYSKSHRQNKQLNLCGLCVQKHNAKQRVERMRNHA